MKIGWGVTVKTLSLIKFPLKWIWRWNKIFIYDIFVCLFSDCYGLWIVLISKRIEEGKKSTYSRDFVVRSPFWGVKDAWKVLRTSFSLDLKVKPNPMDEMFFLDLSRRFGALKWHLVQLFIQNKVVSSESVSSSLILPMKHSEIVIIASVCLKRFLEKFNNNIILLERTFWNVKEPKRYHLGSWSRSDLMETFAFEYKRLI